MDFFGDRTSGDYSLAEFRGGCLFGFLGFVVFVVVVAWLSEVLF
jgi:hypothetical protein